MTIVTLVKKQSPKWLTGSISGSNRWPVSKIRWVTSPVRTGTGCLTMCSFVEMERSSTWSRSLFERSRNNRGSRRLTRNQTDNKWHETTIGLSGILHPRILLKINKNTISWHEEKPCAAVALTVAVWGIWEQILWESPMSCCLSRQEKKRAVVGEKIKRKCFSFSFFPNYSPFNIGCTNVTLPTTQR